jgi:hypothetical protein
VVLAHDHPVLHWDFMFEQQGSLRTWRLAQPPQDGAEIEAQSLADHRLDYLDYEGPVSGGRGCVTRWDRGECEVSSSEAGSLTLRLSGARLRGAATLRPEADGATWTFRYVAAVV